MQVRINGERASVDAAETERQMQKIRKHIEDLAVPKDRIYNWDETGLFYRGGKV